MPDNFVIDGWLVAETSIPEAWPLANVRRGGRLLLFRGEQGWTLLTLRQLTTWRDQEPVDGLTTGSVRFYPNLAAVQARLAGTSLWEPLLKAGAETNAELRALWEGLDGR
jgi:hypothetical protein